MATKIYVAAGHGGNDPGATGNGTNERDFVEPLVDKAIALAKPHLAKNHTIVRVPHSYQYIETVNYFNRTAGSLDILMDVHLNSNAGAPGSGTEVYYGLRAFAQTVQTALVKVLGLPNRGAKYNENFYVTNGAISGGSKSGIIVELGFVNNSKDMGVLKAKGAEALATAIVSASHGKYVALPKPKPVPAPTPAKPDYQLNDAPLVDPGAREMVAIRDTYVIDFKTGKHAAGQPFIAKGTKVSMVRKTRYKNEIYYRSRYAVLKGVWQGLKASDFAELPVIQPVPKPPVPPESEIPEPDYAKDNNSLLRQILELLKKIFNI